MKTRRIDLQQIKLCKVNLAKTKGRGEFKCPYCESKISPDDTTEKVYVVLEVIMRKGSLEKVILQCNKCGSQLHLVGFHVLNRV